jgi:catechol 2,3-dioxygenase-like lactoylglutathione lyase family enzyme
MVLDHVGIVNKDGDETALFYRDFLGLEKVKESSVSSELSRKLFSIDAEITMLVYGKGDLKVEVFILPGFIPSSPCVAHFCIRIPDLPGFLGMAKDAGVKVISAERGGRTVHFIEDFSGNRIEVKQIEKK